MLGYWLGERGNFVERRRGLYKTLTCQAQYLILSFEPASLTVSVLKQRKEMSDEGRYNRGRRRLHHVQQQLPRRPRRNETTDRNLPEVIV